MCSRMAAKLMNSSDESSMGSAVYFSNSVFTENLHVVERQRSLKQSAWLPVRSHHENTLVREQIIGFLLSLFLLYCGRNTSQSQTKLLEFLLDKNNSVTM